MNEEENAKIEDIEVNNEYEVVKTKKEEFDDILAKIEKMSSFESPFIPVRRCYRK